MVKFSTKINFKLVQVFQFVFLKIGSPFIKNKSKTEVKRNNINWSLDLNEVIDFLIFLTGFFDKNGVQTFGKRIKPTDLILDIGANIGSFSIPVSTYLTTGKIYAFEPSDFAFNKFKRNLSLNPNLKSNIEPIQSFVSTENTELPKFVYASWNMDNSLNRHKDHQGVATTTNNAKTVSIDGFIKDKAIKEVNWIKIDVDGFEKDVLLGGVDTFKTLKPNIFMELCSYSLIENNTSVDEILDILISCDYTFEDINGKDLGRDKAKIKRLIPTMGTTNIFAIPFN